MAQNNQMQPPEAQTPIIPPGLLLGLTAVGLVVALVVALTQPEFNIWGIGALGFSALMLVLWAVLNPQQAAGALTGRALRFGGTSVLVTILVIAAMIGIYTVVRGQQFRIDLTERDEFSLNEQSREAIALFGTDPNAPAVKILAFYTAAQAGQRDQNTLLFNDYQTVSAGKVTYEFINPDQNPTAAELYGVNRNGQIIVTALGADGTPDIENAERVDVATQSALTNAVLKVAAGGNFVAYFLNVQDGEADQMTVIKQTLGDSYDWTVEDIGLAQLTSTEGEFRLNDPSRDGEIVIIPGGSRPLAPEELSILQEYVANGGDLLILAAPALNAEGVSLATDAALNDWLFTSYGLRFDNNVIVDQTQAFQSPLIPVATDFDRAAYITTNGIQGQGAIVLESPMSITLNPEAPAGVTVTSLARTSLQSYAKDGLAALNTLLSGTDEAALQQAFARVDSDLSGPFTIAASAETDSGARIILFSSTALATDTFTRLNASNTNVAFNSLVWATNFNNFFQSITIPQTERPQDQPITADVQEVRNINFLTIVVLPFGVLLLGVFVWWTNRETRTRS
jgi:ABC-type uncharacterized transport system involved in gliding motility auxiliary subunit